MKGRMRKAGTDRKANTHTRILVLKCWMSAEFQNNHVYGTPKGSQKCKKKKKKKKFRRNAI
jgi:hypothetical protein